METPILPDEYELWEIYDLTGLRLGWNRGRDKTYEFTLWLCQNSYWKWPFIVDFPIKNGDFP